MIKLLRTISFLAACIIINPGSYLMAQGSGEPNEPAPFPAQYATLTSDTARLHFLLKAIADSLDNARLSAVYEWSKKGLAIAERNHIDSMKGIFNYFIAKAFTYKYGKPDSAIIYYKKVLPFFPGRASKYSVFSIREIMERYSELGNKDSSFVYLDSLKDFIDTMPVTSPRRSSLLQNIATVYQWFGMFKTAIRYYNVAINGNRKNDKTHYPSLGMALANLGELYDEAEDDRKAIQYSKEGLGYLANINMPYMLTASNIATYYGNLSEFDSAFIYFKKADSVAREVNDIHQLVVLRSILGGIYLGQKKYDSARVLLESCIVPLQENGDRWSLSKTYISLASLDSTIRNYTGARENLLKALRIATQDKQEVLAVIALQNLALVSARLSNYKEAFDYQNQLTQKKDSLTSEKTKAELADLEVSYETNGKEQTIKLLQQENDIKTLQLKNNRQSGFFYTVAFLMLLLIAVIIFFQRNRRQKIQTEKMRAELQTQILRSQMNPHFIFNCLNSIENFIMQNDKRQASDYLNKFSLLIRSILDSSRNEVVPVSKDMDALKLYVELEQLRFSNKFSYSFYVDPALKNGDYRVPSLLIQPFVENAIVHGLANSEEDDLSLNVTAMLEDDTIKYIIQDNGIGRKKADEYKIKNKPYHNSVGIKITKERIHNFNGRHAQGQINIIDLYDEHNNADGTKVEITLKTI